MRRQLVPAVIVHGRLHACCSASGYPLVVTGVAQLAFKDKADGSIVERNGKDVGSSLIGQAFVDENGDPIPKYFQSRPSAAVGADGTTEAGYDPTLSSGSNLGPTNPELPEGSARSGSTAYRELNGLGGRREVPVDAVTASGSGLDPHISVANARLQAARVADERGLSVGRVRRARRRPHRRAARSASSARRPSTCSSSTSRSTSLGEAENRRLSVMARGKLRIYLGAAPGVGKTFAMLNEGSAARDAAPTSSSGFVETHGRAEHRRRRSATSRSCPAGGSRTAAREFEEMDVDAVLARQAAGRPGRRDRAHERARARGTRSGGRTSTSSSTPASTSCRR